MTDWKNDGVRVIPAGSLDTNTAQTPGMNRAAAINFARVGAQKLWAGTVTIHAHAKTGAHHHGHLERDGRTFGEQQAELDRHLDLARCVLARASCLLRDVIGCEYRLSRLSAAA